MSDLMLKIEGDKGGKAGTNKFLSFLSSRMIWNQLV